QGLFVAVRAGQLALEKKEEKALVLHTRPTINDGHPVNFFVVGRFYIRAEQELLDGITKTDLVAILQNIGRDLLLVDEGPIGRAKVSYHPAALRVLMNFGVTPGYRVARDHQVGFLAAPDRVPLARQLNAPPNIRPRRMEENQTGGTNRDRFLF